MTYIVFYVLITLCNIIHGITGFAGTVLAMPFSIMLVGYATAKPVLNWLGLVAGVYVFVGNRKHVNWKELKKIVIVMAVGILCGSFLKGFFLGTSREKLMYIALGLFIIYLSVTGMIKVFKPKQDSDNAVKASNLTNLLLAAAGLVHGIFVSGGPLLIGYLTSRGVTDKVSFRATISTCWVFLNGLILATELIGGDWTMSLAGTALIATPFMLVGMFIGGKLCAKMSQQLFLKLTYVLLFISGFSLLIK
jgi:uncharacterized membrane protein YfcA